MQKISKPTIAFCTMFLLGVAFIILSAFIDDVTLGALSITLGFLFMFMAPVAKNISEDNTAIKQWIKENRRYK